MAFYYTVMLNAIIDRSNWGQMHLIETTYAINTYLKYTIFMLFLQ